MLLPLLLGVLVAVSGLAPLKEHVHEETINRVKDGVAQRKFIIVFNHMAPRFGDKQTLVEWAGLKGVKPDDVLHYYAIGRKHLDFHGFSAWLCDATLETMLEQSIVEYVEEDVVVSLDFTREPLLKAVTKVPVNVPWQQRIDWGQARINTRLWNLSTFNTTTGAANAVYNARPPAIYANPYPNNQFTQAWNWTYGNSYQLPSHGKGSIVWILDTGIKVNHDEFRDAAGNSRVDISVNFVDPPDNGIDDLNGHGTHCAGTAAGNYRGIAKDAVLRSVRVLGAGGSGTWAGVIAGIDYVANQQVGGAGNILSASLGGGAHEAVDKAIDAAVRDGVIAVVAAGNSNNNACGINGIGGNSPARASMVIAVAASDSTDTIASFSSFGPCIKSTAPGVTVTSAWITPSGQTGNDYYNDISGTSMATPHVAGAIAVHVATSGILHDPDSVKADLALDQTKGIVGGLTGNKESTPNLFIYSQWKQGN